MENQFYNEGSVPYQQNQGMYQQRLSKAEFYKHPGMKKCRGDINASAILLYVCAGLSLVLQFFTLPTIFDIISIMIDVCLIVGLALGIQLGKSRVCAILITIYGAFNVVVMTISTGRLSGYWILIAAIYAIKATFQYHKEWENYQRTGQLPGTLNQEYVGK